MMEVGTWLRAADPVPSEPGLTAPDIQAMRRAMIAAVEERASLFGWSPRPAMVAATVALTLAAAVAIGLRLPIEQPSDVASVVQADPQATATARRQLQFATPGGTRIIWVFNQDFEP